MHDFKLTLASTHTLLDTLSKLVHKSNSAVFLHTVQKRCTDTCITTAGLQAMSFENACCAVDSTSQEEVNFKLKMPQLL